MGHLSPIRANFEKRREARESHRRDQLQKRVSVLVQHKENLKHVRMGLVGLLSVFDTFR